MDLLKKKAALTDAVFRLNMVRAVAQTGDIDETPLPGKGDFDLFVFCDEIPAENERRAAYDTCPEAFSECRMTVCEGGHWGTEDALVVEGVDTFFMYFTVEGMRGYISDVLDGKYPDSENGFYPTGRLATIDTINVLAEKGDTMEPLKALVREYPEALSKALFDYHYERIVDEEDFGRAVSRRDVLFYHMVLENSIDHFLQALYAMNKTYFPSRKRTEQYMAAFSRIPADCYARMIRVVEDGSCSESMQRSYDAWLTLVDELGAAADR